MLFNPNIDIKFFVVYSVILHNIMGDKETFSSMVIVDDWIVQSLIKQERRISLPKFHKDIFQFIDKNRPSFRAFVQIKYLKLSLSETKRP